VIRKGKWKLHDYFEDGGFELYNLENDLGEQHNLSDEMPEKVEELHSMLKQWRKKTGAPVPKKLNPDFKKDTK
ncbi:MAG: aryl-sulfate sulfohydrolase, partial [Clostridia bacterium]|nr:aryl-sulfate sulfohydrolase [Clostridia bacterium]